MQYRLQFSSADGKNTALVRSVKLAHTIPNLPPRLKNVTVKRAAATKSSTRSVIQNCIMASTRMFEIMLFYLFVLFFWVLIGYRSLQRDDYSLFQTSRNSLYANYDRYDFYGDNYFFYHLNELFLMMNG